MSENLAIPHRLSARYGKRKCMGGIKHRESCDTNVSILMKIKAAINVVQQMGKREKLGFWRDHLGYKTGLGRI